MSFSFIPRDSNLASMHAVSPAKEFASQDITKTARLGILFESNTGDSHLDEHLGYIRNADWASTSLGPLESWPQDLTQLCQISLLDPNPRSLILGPDRILFYNEAYSELCGDRHPHALGQNVIEAWGEVAQDLISGPLETAERTGRRVQLEDQPLVCLRNGFLERVYVRWTIVPLAGYAQGVYVSLKDSTETMLAEKRRAAIRALNTAWNVVQDPLTFWQSIPQSLALDPFLFPFAFLYTASSDPDSEYCIDTSPEPTQTMRFKLEGAVGSSEITSHLPGELDPGHFELLSDLIDPILFRSNETPKPTWSLSAQDCILCPISSNRSQKVIAYLFLGIDPKRPYNDAYREWMNEFTRCLSNAVTSALQSEELARNQRRRAAAVASEQHLLVTALADRDKEVVAVNEELQRTLEVVDMADVGVFNYDLEGRLIYANDAFSKMTACPPEMMHGKELVFLDLTYPEDTEYLMPKWKCATSGQSCTFEMRYRGPKNEGLWVLAAVVPVLKDGIVTSVSGCVTNIQDTKSRETESAQRLQALERAKAWEQRFANFAELAPVAIFFGSQSYHHLSYCNRAWFEITGHPVVAFEQIDWSMIVYEEDLELVRSMWTEVIAANEAVSTQFRLRRRWSDGNGVVIGPVWVTASVLPEYKEDGSIKGIIGTMLDISALKFAETVQHMKAQEALEAKRQSSNFIDMVSHEIRNPLSAVFHCADAAQDTLADMLDLASRLASAPKSESGNQLRELIAYAVDSINTIISCTQHQKGYAFKSKVLFIYKCANSILARIVDDILVLSKLDSNLLQITPSAVKVTALLRDVEKMFEAEAQRSNVQLQTQAHPSLEELNVSWAMLDPGRVQQVLINLLTNAIKFCKKKQLRKVTIRAGASRIRPSENVLPDIDFVVAHSLHDSVYDSAEFESHSFYLWFTVEDTGRGMSAEEKTRIFARFSQGSARTETEYGGSGLGLFISRELSELQGGEIGVASTLDVGSTFAFFVKTHHTDAPASTKGLPIQLKQKIKKSSADINILVVEDNAVNQKVLRKQLTNHAYTVSVADNGLDCLDYLRTTKHWRGNPSSAPALSVILMDIEMPKMNGLEATKMIRQYEKEGKLMGHIPIIAVSANARQEQTNMALEAGMDDSIAKPFRIPDLVPKIERLAGWM